MFGHNSLPSKRYRYGALRPHGNLDLVLDQFYLMHKYANKRIELELLRRKEYYDTLRLRHPDVVRLMDEYSSIKAKLKAARAEIRGINAASRNKTMSAEQRKTTAEMKKLETGVYTLLKAAKLEAGKDAETVKLLKERDNEHHARVRAARADSGLYWGNYLEIDNAAKSFAKGAPPKFRVWREALRLQKICVQVQNGISFEEALSGKNTLIRIKITETRGTDSYAEVLLRVGSDEKTKPVWCKFDMLLHRRPPADAVIKWINLIRTWKGTRDEWSVDFVVSRRSGWAHEEAATTGIVGVDVNWRVTPEGLRVAVWAGSDGKTGSLTLSTKDLSRWEWVSKFQNWRARLLATTVDRLTKFAETCPKLPDWWEARTQSMSRWGPSRMVELVLFWETNRFVGDDDIFSLVHGYPIEGIRLQDKRALMYHGWFLQDRRLLDFEDGTRKRAVRWRNDVYRCLASQLRKEYATVVIEDTDWSKLAKKAAAEKDDKVENLTASSNRQLAAPGILSRILTEGFNTTLFAPAANTTRKCWRCGKMDAFDAATELVRICRHCNEKDDQDSRAAMNLLAFATSPEAAEAPRSCLAVDPDAPPKAGGKTKRKTKND